MNILVVRWSDKKGSHKKEYTDQRIAYKARKWLLDNGADDVDRCSDEYDTCRRP